MKVNKNYKFKSKEYLIDDLHIQIGKFIQGKRIEANLSLQELSKILGITNGLLSEFEAGEKKIPLNQIYSIANYLNIPPNEIIQLLNKFSIEI